MKIPSFIKPGAVVRLRNGAKAEIYAIKPRQHWCLIGALQEDHEWFPMAWNKSLKASDFNRPEHDDIVGVWEGK